LDQGVFPGDSKSVAFKAGTRLQNPSTAQECFIPGAKIVFLPPQRYDWRQFLSSKTSIEAAPMDLVVLKTDILAPESLKLDFNEVRVGEPLLVAGYPTRLGRANQDLKFEPFDDRSLFFSTDKVRCLTDHGFLSCVAAGPGSSGSPTLNSKGDVVGLLVGQVRGQDDSAPDIQHVGTSILSSTICENLIDRWDSNLVN
jgi:S1-C subfamily serine protease